MRTVITLRLCVQAYMCAVECVRLPDRFNSGSTEALITEFLSADYYTVFLVDPSVSKSTVDNCRHYKLRMFHNVWRFPSCYVVGAEEKEGGMAAHSAFSHPICYGDCHDFVTFARSHIRYVT